MNMQKMGKLCKENMCMKLYRKGYTQYISDGITMVEIPRDFPALNDETEVAAVFGWTDKQLEEISCEVEGLDVINGLYEVTGHQHGRCERRGNPVQESTDWVYLCRDAPACAAG